MFSPIRVWAKSSSLRVKHFKRNEQNHIEWEMRFTRVTSWSFVLTLLSNELCFKSEKYRAAGDGERERARSGSSSVFLSTQFSGKRATENFTVFSFIFNASTFLRCRALSRFACTFVDCVSRERFRMLCAVCWNQVCAIARNTIFETRDWASAVWNLIPTTSAATSTHCVIRSDCITYGKSGKVAKLHRQPHN